MSNKPAGIEDDDPSEETLQKALDDAAKTFLQDTQIVEHDQGP